MKKGSTLKVEKTLGLDSGSYDLYDIRGLSLGKLQTILHALEEFAQKYYTMPSEMIPMLRNVDPNQTIGGK